MTIFCHILLYTYIYYAVFGTLSSTLYTLKRGVSDEFPSKIPYWEGFGPRIVSAKSRSLGFQYWIHRVNQPMVSWWVSILGNALWKLEDLARIVNHTHLNHQLSVGWVKLFYFFSLDWPWIQHDWSFSSGCEMIVDKSDRYAPSKLGFSLLLLGWRKLYILTISWKKRSWMLHCQRTTRERQIRLDLLRLSATMKSVSTLTKYKGHSWLTSESLFKGNMFGCHYFSVDYSSAPSKAWLSWTWWVPRGVLFYNDVDKVNRLSGICVEHHTAKWTCRVNTIIHWQNPCIYSRTLCSGNVWSLWM